MLSEVKVVADRQALVSPLAEPSMVSVTQCRENTSVQSPGILTDVTPLNSQLAPSPRVSLLACPISFTLHLGPDMLNKFTFQLWLLFTFGKLPPLCMLSGGRECVSCSLM